MDEKKQGNLKKKRIQYFKKIIKRIFVKNKCISYINILVVTLHTRYISCFSHSLIKNWRTIILYEIVFQIRDASYCYGSSGEENDEENDNSNAIHQRGEVSAAVNTVLYAGLGTTALGLIISFVGTGEKGFLSPGLRLVGPSLLCAGLLCCLFRVLLCLCLCRCGPCHWRFCHIASHKKEKARKAEARSTGTLPTASLLLPMQQQQQHQQQDWQPLAPVSHSVPPAIKGHELLLSPAQLPEWKDRTIAPQKYFVRMNSTMLILPVIVRYSIF